MNITVVSDTHLKSDVARKMPPKAAVAVREADCVLHAGDVVSLQALRDFEELSRTYAVLGNNDHELCGLLPESLTIELDGVIVAMVHDAGPKPSRPARLFSRFPSAKIVVFGHSHVPCHEIGLNGQILLNPGSPTQRRGQPSHTIARLVIEHGELMSAKIEVV